jgi:hypothetical protein
MLVENLEGRPLGRSCWWKDTIKMDLREIALMERGLDVTGSG